MGEARIRRGSVTASIVHLLDTCPVDEIEHARIVCRNVVDPMAVVGHDETAAHRKKHLQVDVNMVICYLYVSMAVKQT
jgi:hypothetical protein